MPSDALAATLEDIAVFVRRFVVLGEEQLTAVALWTAHTHALDAAEQSPYLAITSPTKRAGKSRLLDVLELVAARPWRVISPSEAVVFRKLDRDHPTLLLDEVDAIWSSGPTGANHEGLRAILNAGNRRGTTVPRCGGPRGDQLEEFRVFGAKALAGIGSLPETVADRSIPLRLRRKTPAEHVDRFRRREALDAAEPIALSLTSILDALLPELAERRPEIPEELDDRAQEGWEPLLAIADAAGGDWPDRARRAAVELSTAREVEDEAVSIRLLADLRSAFDANGDRLSTAELIEALAQDTEAPWATWHRGERISPRGLAELLRPFAIRSRSVRLADGTTPKGYLREQFEDPWSRYLSPEIASLPIGSAFLSATAPQPASVKGLSAHHVSATNDVVADTERAANPHDKSVVALWRIDSPNNTDKGPAE